MAEQVSPDPGEDYGGYASGEEERQLTDDLIAHAKTRVGARLRVRDGWNTKATRDAIRHYAQSQGMDNPLYSDPAYAASTRWQSIIAPPTFNCSVAEDHEWTDEEKERARDPLHGIHAWWAGAQTQYVRPVNVDDVLVARSYQGDYIKKSSEFTGRSVLDYVCTELWNQRDELVQRSTAYSIRGGRQRRWGERTKYVNIEPQTYEPDDIARIDADYARMTIRGATPRYWEDVVVGESLVPTVYGPLTVTDMLARASGYGLAMTGSSAFKVAHDLRSRVPQLFLLNEAGIPDVIEAVHWDPAIARRTGNPMPYDYGTARAAFLAHVVTNWMGDDGWLRSLDYQIRTFVYLGDTVWAKGSVTAKRVVDGQHVVDIDVWAEDQRGRNTAPGRAQVALPSREHGPVVIPQPFPEPPPGWHAG